jgi:hypothetical protein
VLAEWGRVELARTEARDLLHRLMSKDGPRPPDRTETTNG